MHTDSEDGSANGSGLDTGGLGGREWNGEKTVDKSLATIIQFQLPPMYSLPFGRHHLHLKHWSITYTFRQHIAYCQSRLIEQTFHFPCPRDTRKPYPLLAITNDPGMTTLMVQHPPSQRDQIFDKEQGTKMQSEEYER